VIGKNIGALLHGAAKHERFVTWYLGAKDRSDAGWSREWTAKRKDRSEVPADVNVTAVAAGARRRYTCFVRDISERKRVEESTRMLAYHDTLTGLPNRALFYDRLRQAIALGKRSGQRFAVLYLDLDGYKAVNDEWGHDAGDQLLKSAAQRVRGVLRESDTVARMGGDEFVVILARSEGRVNMARVARKIIDAMAVPFPLGERRAEARITGSIGIAVYPEDGDEIDVLVKRADSAMYQAKRTGGAFCFAGHEATGKRAH
jgi:diguanylate cyclase (GGDEF)-like protein